MSALGWQDAVAAAAALAALAWLVMRRVRASRAGASAACEGCEGCDTAAPPLAKGETLLVGIDDPRGAARVSEDAR